VFYSSTFAVFLFSESLPVNDAGDEGKFFRIISHAKILYINIFIQQVHSFPYKSVIYISGINVDIM